MKKRAFVLLLIYMTIISGFFLLPGKSFSSVNMARLTQEAPGLHNYPGSDGVIWYREVNYSLTADGRMEKDSTWIILAKKGLDEKWRNWEIPVYPEGSVEVLHSSLYDPGTSTMMTPVLAETAESGNMEIVQIRFPELQDEYLIYLSYREIIPKDCRLDDFLWMALDLPLWENRINVNVPQGSELFYSSQGVDPPVIEKQVDATKRYGWSSFNLSPRNRSSLAVNPRSFLAFSLRRGETAFARDIQVLSSPSIPPLPASVAKFNHEANKTSAGSKMIGFIEEASLLRGFPASYVRRNIPENPPWSVFEKVILLSDWLSRAGWNSRLYWSTTQPLTEETPDTGGLVSMPILEITPPGGSSVFYQLGQGFSNSDLPPQMWGRTVYGYQDGALLKRQLPKGEASDHRLNINWILDLTEDGTLSGNLEILVRNGWKAMLLEDGRAFDESVSGMLYSLKIPGFDPDKIKISPIKYGSRITVPVMFNSAIISGNNLLLNFPPVLLDPLLDLGKMEPGYELKFPFVVDHSFEISFPDGYETVALPATSDRDFGVIRLNEDISINKKKRRISGNIKLLVNTDGIDTSIHRALIESLREWLMWMDKTVPLHKK